MAKMLTTRFYNICFHFIAYNTVWVASIYSAARGYMWLGLLIATLISLAQILWLRFIEHRIKNLMAFIAYLTLIGCIGDSLLIYFNTIQFMANPLPFPLTAPFMIGIWINFSVFFYAVLQSFIMRPFLLALLAFFGFIAAYFFGATLGAAILILGINTLLIIGLTWAIALPLSITIFNRYLPLAKG